VVVGLGRSSCEFAFVAGFTGGGVKRISGLIYEETSCEREEEGVI
jgi:hypothetical protein